METPQPQEKPIDAMTADELKAVLAQYPKGQMIDSGEMDRVVYPAQQRLKLLEGTSEAVKAVLVP